MESAASGIVAGRSLAARILGKRVVPLPEETMIGSLCRYISDPSVEDFQPMGSNMGILPPLETPVKGKELRYTALADRATDAMKRYVKEIQEEE